jgi:hypothetical protein
MSISDFLLKSFFFISSVYFFVVIVFILDNEVKKITGVPGVFLFYSGLGYAFGSCFRIIFTPSKKKD